MANLRLSVQAQLKNLIPFDTNTYKFIVQYYDQNSILLTNTQLQQNAEVIVSPVANTFDLAFPIESGTYTIPNVKIKVFNNSTQGGCTDEFDYTIAVNCSSAVCSPVVSISGTVTQECIDENTVHVNGTGLSGLGGNETYRWAIVKESLFVSVNNLAFGTSKEWNVDHGVAYRIYVKDTSNSNHPTCYAYFSFDANDCGGEIETTMYVNE